LANSLPILDCTTASNTSATSVLAAAQKTRGRVGWAGEEPEAGVPQGSPLSPLLGNIMLHELDKELTHRGHKFVRYADDMLILCKSRRKKPAFEVFSHVLRVDGISNTAAYRHKKNNRKT
jgi:retron-type reverse transcriptase